MFLTILQFLSCTALFCASKILAIGTIHSRPKPTNESKSLYYPSPYNLEDHCGVGRESLIIHIDSWKGAIFQLGYQFESDGSPKSRKIHKCRIRIKTDKDFWLVAAIEHMKIRGSRDSSNKWICTDYVQFSSSSRNLVGKFFSALELDYFNDRKSEKLCGNKRLDGEYYENIFDVSTDANSFSTASNEMVLSFHQRQDERHALNNSFRVIITSFRHASEEVFAVECEGKQRCYSQNIYCIDKSFICDGHINCAFPGSATDERLCSEAKKPKVFSMTSLIVITLTGMVSLGIAICLFSTFICRLKARLGGDRRTTVNSTSGPFLPSFDVPTSEAPLPAYETIILSDRSKDPATEDLPPNYEALFPPCAPPLPSSDK